MAVVRPILAHNVTGFTTLKDVMSSVLFRVAGRAQKSAGRQTTLMVKPAGTMRLQVLQPCSDVSLIHAHMLEQSMDIALSHPVTMGHRLALPEYAGIRSPAIHKYQLVLPRR